MVLNEKEISAIRLGTCGGIGLTPGTVVVTEQAVDGRLQPYLETVTLPIPDIFESIIFQIILGNVVSREAKLDLDLAEKLVEAGKGAGSFETVLGKTISTNDFYEGQVKEVLKKWKFKMAFAMKGWMGPSAKLARRPDNQKRKMKNKALKDSGQ